MFWCYHIYVLYCRDICCVSVQGLHPSKDPAYAVFEGESFGETLLTASTVVKWQRSRLWSISWLRHQMFYPDIKISAAQARESDDLHHPMSPFSFILSSFTGGQRILGYGRPWRKDSSGAFYKLREKKAASAGCISRNLWIGTAFARCNWPSNATSEGCRPWIETQQSTEVSVLTSELRLRISCSSSVNTNTPLVHELPFQTASCTFCRLFNCTWIVSNTNQNTDTDSKLPVGPVKLTKYCTSVLCWPSHDRFITRWMSVF